MLYVHPVPTFTDNYVWVLHNDTHAIAVDPGEALPVAAYLAAQRLTLTAILTTHHHADHVGGVVDLLKLWPGKNNIPVYGPARERIPARTHGLREGEKIRLPEPELTLDILDVPGHTAGHIAYLGQGMLFCGDTLFGCGCGRLFEGTAAQMSASLAKLAALPGNTRVYCAHEYTLSNIRFAEVVEPDNPALKQRKIADAHAREQGLPTLPSTIALECATNPFLRCAQTTVNTAACRYAGNALHLLEEIFAALRDWKDHFKT